MPVPASDMYRPVIHLEIGGKNRYSGCDIRNERKGTCPVDRNSSQILIVDDDTALLDQHIEGLADDYRIVAVQTGRVGVERVKRKKDIDLAVVEYRLPDMSGIDVLREIKDAAPSVPVIIVTAYGDEDVAVEAFRSGARDYIKKPFSMADLSTKIDFYLALKRADQKRRKNVLPRDGALRDLALLPSAVTLSQYHKVQHALRFINDNYKTDIRLVAAAGAAGMSPAHFSRIFKKVMGVSYQDYLNNRRITKAQNLLRSSAQTITEIALSLGFADATGFGRIFKKLTNQTPSVYRSRPRK